MSWTDYKFDFLRTVSKQLIEELNSLKKTELTGASLDLLSEFQKEKKLKEGVYILYLDDSPVYLGKSDNIRDRLHQHISKLRGRLSGELPIDVSRVFFKALLLDNSMSTAANEKLLISEFSIEHEGLWNGKGFGPRDPGVHRDTTEPSYFDKTYPINKSIEVPGIPDRISIGELFSRIKEFAPFVFRFEVIPGEVSERYLDLNGRSRSADALMSFAITAFPPNWHYAIVSFGMVVYSSRRAYWHTSIVGVSPGSPPPLPPLKPKEKKEKKTETKSRAKN
ncbi:hypothetical protein D3C81_1070220 [compost metagenome]